MVEIEGMIKSKPIYILIDPCASLSYVSPSVAESCNLHLNKFEKSWLVQLAIGTKRKVVSYVDYCELFMGQFKTQVKLNVLPIGSYDGLVGMDWMENHIVVLNFFEKTFTCIDEKGETIIGRGIPRKVYVRHISSLQMKMFVRKGCKNFVINVMNDEHMNKEDKLKFDDIPILKSFSDVYPKGIP